MLIVDNDNTFDVISVSRQQLRFPYNSNLITAGDQSPRWAETELMSKMSALNMAMNGNAYKMIEIKKVSVIYILYDNTFLSYDDQLDFFQNMGWRNSFGKV